jgi:BlaI family transcriptional regulator, penicillinase repressor
MRRKRSAKPDLSAAQQELMDIIWERGEISASELGRLLPRHRALARNTVRTMLVRMEEKGWLKHREEGRTYLYSAVLPRQATIGDKLRELVDTLCGGSPETLVTALLDDRGLSDAELDRIRALLDNARRKKNDSK